MRNTMKSYGIGVCLLLLSALLPVSCIQDDYTAGEKASVTMTFTTRTQGASPLADGSSALLANEQMKTLRVIVARTATQEVLYNVKYTTFDVGDNGQLYKTITFSELTTSQDGEDFDFYAIANEEALGGLPDGKNISMTELKSRVLTNDFNSPVLSQLPQAAYKKIHVAPQENNAATMQLMFPVAKVNLSFINTTGSEQTISNIGLHQRTPDRANLFYDGNMPANVSLSKAIGFDDVVLSATEENTAAGVRYVYPGETGEHNVLTAQWNNKKYTLPLTVDNKVLTNLARGMQYDVTVTLKGGGLTVSCNVLDWDDLSHEILLSDKGEFAITIVNALPFSWGDNNKAIATQFGEGAGADDRYATLTLRMTSPKGVIWRAHLDNPDFEFVGESEGVGGGQEVTLKIRPVKTYDAQVRSVTRLYVTIGTKPNEKALFVSQEYRNELCTDNGTDIPIVQVSSAEGDGVWRPTINP